MILYTIDGKGGYINISDLKDVHHAHIYVNLTNRCPCSCTFCLRRTKKMLGNNTLWLKEEPSVEEVKDLLNQYHFEVFDEIIFCGFGEPTERIEDIKTLTSYIKSKAPDIKLRINTNGLGNDIHKKDITPLLDDFDVISVSLNAPDKEEYYSLTRSKFGIDSFDDMLAFSALAKRYAQVVLTVVDIIGGDKIEKCQRICDELGVTLRVRPYEE